MKNKINFDIAKFFLFGIIILLSGISVSAFFGVGFTNSKIGMYPGQVLDESFSIQNYEVNVSDIAIEVVIEKGSEYISLTGGSTFQVPKQSSVAVPVRISVPENSRVGDVYTLNVLFKDVSGTTTQSTATSGTTVGFIFSQSRTIEIEVIEKPELPPETPQEEGISAVWWILGIVAVIVVIVVLWFIVKSKK